MNRLRWALTLACMAAMVWGIWRAGSDCNTLVAGRMGAVSVAAALMFLFLGNTMPSRILTAKLPGKFAKPGTQMTPGEQAKAALEEYFHANRRERWALALITAAGTLLWAYSDLVPGWVSASCY